MGNNALPTIQPRCRRDYQKASGKSVPGYVTKLARLVQLANVITTAVAVIAGLLTASGTAAAGESPADFIP